MKNILIASVSSAALMFGAAQAGPDKEKPVDETAMEETTVDTDVAPEGEGDIDYDAASPEGDEGDADESGDEEGEEDGEADPE